METTKKPYPGMTPYLKEIDTLEKKGEKKWKEKRLETLYHHRQQTM